MLLGIIADDFTGAGDIANTITKGFPKQGGLRTTQYLRIPESPAAQNVEAGVIALKSRSIPVSEAVELSLRALDWLKGQGCEQIVFKYCSTFDSTRAGNIGPVGEALAQRLGVAGVVACPAFPSTGRTVYQGHLFVGNRLLNESGMQNHPLNPMTDPDIRRWLAQQTSNPVGLIDLETVRAGPAAISSELVRSERNGGTLVIVDAVADQDLLAIGTSAACAPFLTGGSGIAQGLPANFIGSGKTKGHMAASKPIDGAEAILVGSCSAKTQQQIDFHAHSHPALAIDVEAVMEGRITTASLVDFVLANAGRAPLVYSSQSPDQIRSSQDIYGRDAIARELDQLFAATARGLVRNGVRRLVVAGGETSGAVVSALDVEALAIGPEIDPGVPVLTAEGGEPLALALKSGNFGSMDFFTKALARLSGK
jgi:uncharacterized protein YgbK (DUF1537 family)